MKPLEVLLIFFILFSAGCRNSGMKTGKVEAVRVRIVAITDREISIPVHSTGSLVSSEELKLSFKTGGIVAEIKVKEGDRVKKGDLLASLNLAEIAASEEQAKSGYEKALRDYGRAENLYMDSVTTLEQKQNAATALNAAKSTLEIVKFNLEHSRIFAPDNGLILKQFVKQNELVSPGYPVFLFGTSGKYWKVRTGLADKDMVRIHPGDSALIYFDAYPAVKFPAVVDKVGEISNPYTGTYETELLLKGSDYRLASGFIAGVDIFPAMKKAFTLVPVGSIVEADGEQGYVYVLAGSDNVRKIKVDIESLIGPMVAVQGIPEGIKEVVSEGVAYLKDGMKVIVVK